MKYNTGIIYRIRNIQTDQSYVGQTTETGYPGRISSHFGKSGSPTLREAIEKYGRSAFTVEKLEENAPINALDMMERYWIKSLDSYNQGYNLTLGGGRGNKTPTAPQQRKQRKEKKRFTSEDSLPPPHEIERRASEKRIKQLSCGNFQSLHRKWAAEAKARNRDWTNP